jgi:hypothetical protein
MLPTECGAVPTLAELASEIPLCRSITLKAFSDPIHYGGKRIVSQLVPHNSQAEQVEVSLLGIGQLIEMLNTVNNRTVSSTSGCLDLNGALCPLEVVS